MITLIKYQNRKIYSPDTSSYVNHKELIQLISDGEDIRVICNKTKEDVTSSVKTELVYTFLKSNPLSSSKVRLLFTNKEL